jgi:hypothetical protein
MDNAFTHDYLFEDVEAKTGSISGGHATTYSQRSPA